MIPHAGKIGIFLLILIMSGCATRQVVIDQAVIRNETRGVITQVKVLHEPTERFGEVHSILPQSSFDLGFSKQPLRGEKAIVTWTSQHGQKNKVELLYCTVLHQVSLKLSHCSWLTLFTLQDM